MKIKYSAGDKAFRIVCFIVMGIFAISYITILLYMVLYVDLFSLAAFSVLLPLRRSWFPSWQLYSFWAALLS